MRVITSVLEHCRKTSVTFDTNEYDLRIKFGLNDFGNWKFSMEIHYAN